MPRPPTSHPFLWGTVLHAQRVSFGTDVDMASPFLPLSDLFFDSVEVNYPILRRPAWLFPPAQGYPQQLRFR